MEAEQKLRSAVICFPGERVQRSARVDASRWQIWRGRLRELAGKGLNALGVPGALQPVEHFDKLTGQHVSVSVGELFVCISVNGRDFYFNRLTGRFDGTGAARA